MLKGAVVIRLLALMLSKTFIENLQLNSLAWSSEDYI